jgi:hypothetical protein
MHPSDVPQAVVDAMKTRMKDHNLRHDDSDTGFCDHCLRVKVVAALPAIREWLAGAS